MIKVARTPGKARDCKLQIANCKLQICILQFAICNALLGGMTAAADDSPPIPRPYQTAHDAALDSTESPVTEADDHTQLRVEFNGIRGDRVPAFLYVPKGDQSKRPTVLLQYGSGGDKKVNYIVELGHQFVAHGFVVLTIDSPGRGERKSNEKKRTDWLFSNDGRDTFLQYCGDYSRAVDYLVARPEVDPDRIGYVGISWGAITGVTYVAHDPRIKAMGSMVGGGNFLGIAGAINGNKSEEDKDKEKPISIDPVRHVGQIAPRPLLLLNVTKDQLVLRPFADALHNAAGDGAKKIWLETDHYFTGVDRHEVGETVIEFILDNLRKKDE
jgi:dienelactone hydrolase